jgi:hypothetical protein
MTKYIFLFLAMISVLSLGNPVIAGGSTPTVAKIPIYFIKYAGGENFNYVGPLRKVGAGKAEIYNFALNKLIQGPTAYESAVLKYKSAFKLVGLSNCGGANYTKIFDAPTNTLSVRFCKDIEPYIYPGGVAGSYLKAAGRAKNVIIKSLRIDVYSDQPGYQGIDKVIIRTKNYGCFANDVQVVNEGVCYEE